MRCPKCSVDMNEMSLLATTIDVCPLCNGCWLDKNELTRITRSRGKDAVSLALVEKKKTQFNCPRCKSSAVLHEGKHELNEKFLIDECEKCGGIWLDRGELPTLLSMNKPS